MLFVEKILCEKFYEIIEKHNNPIWAREELEWLVYDKHRCEYDQLPKEDKENVDHFFLCLRKIHGGE